MGKSSNETLVKEDVPQAGKANSKKHAPGRPGRKTRNNDEIQRRVELAAILLGQRMLKHAVIAILKERFGISARTCETLLARARELLVARSGKSHEEHFNEAAAYWLSILQDPRYDIYVKMRAEENLERLYGLWRRPGSLAVEMTGDKSTAITVVSFGVVGSPAQDNQKNDHVDRNGDGHSRS
jgi:hypothetical protein